MQFTNIRRDEDAGAATAAGAVREPASPAADPWTHIPTVSLDRRHLARNRVVTYGRHDPAHVAFDLLRTRLVQALKARGWSRVAITSPSKGCGKTFVAANLALSLARRPSCRGVLVDLDLRIPNLARVLGIRDTARTVDFLAGRCPPEALLRRIAENLAVGAHSEPFADSAELIQEPSTAAALERLRESLQPDVILYDLPPALACDDVIALLPQVDGVLLVAAAGKSSPNEIRQCERLLVGQAPLLGVILNKAEDPPVEPYYS